MRILIFLLLFCSFQPSWAQLKNQWAKQESNSGQFNDKSVTFICREKLYTCLGTNRVEFRKEVWNYSFENNSWEPLENFPGLPRISTVAFSIGDKAYIGTGLIADGGTQQATNDFWEYIPEKDKWIQKTNFPGAIRYGAVAFVLNNKGYIGLGANQSTYYNDLWEYDPELNKWTKKADFPDIGRTDASVFVINNEAYILFGQSKELLLSPKKSWKYLPATDEWKQLTDFPGSPRIGTITFAHKNKGYALGGSNGAFKRYAECWEFDATKNRWIENENIPFGTCSYGFAYMWGDTAIIHSGKKRNDAQGIEFWKYNLHTPPKKCMIGGRLLANDDRMPQEDMRINIFNKEGKIIQSVTTNLYGTFLAKDLPDNQELRISVEAKNQNDSYCIINKNNEEIAVLKPDNGYQCNLLSSSEKAKINTDDLRMDLQGKITIDNKKKTPLSNASIIITDEKENVVTKGMTDETGYFSFNNLPVDSALYLMVKQKNKKNSNPDEKLLLLSGRNNNILSRTSAASATFSLTNISPETNSLMELYIEDPWLPYLLQSKSKLIEPIYFDVSKWDILPSAKSTLSKAIVLLKHNPNYFIAISAHTDCRGDSAANQALSEKRALAAKEYMILKGVSVNQVEAKGYGETQLLNNCADGAVCSEEKHAQNRRLEFSITIRSH
jgi:outer membrane protein OmpA-like peptidoglycan-associated protein